MYTIEYDKTKKEKPVIEEPKYSGNSFREDYMNQKAYLRRKELNDLCWNIKSLTIDMEDIKYIMNDRSLHCLFGLYAKVKRSDFDKKYDTLTILNNNPINKTYICEIIKCKWMVNANEELNNSAVTEMLIRLSELFEQFKTGQYPKRKIDDEIKLINYFVDTIKNKYNRNSNDNNNKKARGLKLDNYFIKDKE